MRRGGAGGGVLPKEGGGSTGSTPPALTWFSGVKAAGGGGTCNLPEGARRRHRVAAPAVHVVEHVEGSGGEAELGRFVFLAGGEMEVVAPAQVEVYICRAGLSVAAHAVRPGVEESVAVSVGAGDDCPRCPGVGEDAGREVEQTVGVEHGVHAQAVAAVPVCVGPLVVGLELILRKPPQ